MKIEIKTFNPATNYSGPTFYLLNKGMNAGKPSYQPFRNSFVVQCDDQDTLDYLYWLCWGLWETKHFHYFLKGSVIPYVSLPEIREFVIENFERNLIAEVPIEHVTKKMVLCNNAIVLTRKKVELYRQLKQSYFTTFVKIYKPWLDL